MSTTYKLSKIDTVINNPDPDSLGTYQDTGNQNVEITITGIITNARESSHQVRRNIRTFGLRPSITSALKFGAVGLRLDGYEEFNITPSATRGAVIQEIELANPVDEPTKIGFIARIRILGNKGTSPNYSWV